MGIYVYRCKLILIDFYEESITCGFETAPLLTAVKNIGQCIFYDPAIDLKVYEGFKIVRAYLYQHVLYYEILFILVMANTCASSRGYMSDEHYLHSLGLKY